MKPFPSRVCGAAFLRGGAVARESLRCLRRKVIAALHADVLFEAEMLLADHPDLAPFCGESMDVRGKLLRRYLGAGFTRAGAARCLLHHYRFLSARGLVGLVTAAMDRRVVLAEIAGKAGQGFECHIRQLPDTCLEGEFKVSLTDGDGCELYRAHAAVIPRGGEPVLFVGCFQGACGADVPERMREATKALHHRRPREVLLQLLQGFADAIGCAGVLLVSSAGRPGRRGRWSFRCRPIACDYDAMWEEFGADRIDRFTYLIPALGAIDTACTSIPQKRRADRRRSAESLNAAIAGMRTTLTHWRSGTEGLVEPRCITDDGIAVRALASRCGRDDGSENE